MIGPAYWTTGVTLKPHGRGWVVTLEFLDDGFAQQGSTEGTLRYRYVTKDLDEAIDTLIEDATRLGIQFGVGTLGPTVYIDGDGEPPEGDRPDLREVANEQARRIGWQQIYDQPCVS